MRLHWQELGSGPPLVMLHGLLVGSLATWYFTAAPALAARGHVVLYDLRGHGLSERAPSGYDVATQVDDLAAVVDAVGPEPVTLVGHSFGAFVALAYALRHPTRVAKLAVVEAPLPPSRVSEMEGFAQKSPEEMLASLPEALRDALARGGRQARRFVDSLRFLVTETSLLTDLRRAKDIPDDTLGALACPLLAIYGTTSSCRAAGARLASVVPRGRLVELPGGHFLPLEAPSPLTDALVEFVHG